MMDLTQDIKITCQNSIIKGAGAHTVEGHPMRNWKIKLVAVDGGKEKKGRLTELLDHVEYILHPTFKDPRRVVTKEPYLLQEKGWGEFDMRIVLYFTNNIANTELLSFDLNFRQAQYSVVKTVVFQNPSPELVNILNRDPVPLPAAKKRRSTSTEKARKTTKSPASPKITANSSTTTTTTTTTKEHDSMSGASLSPSTPHFTQQPTGYSSAYSASPQPHSFTSPNGVINSPYDYTQNIKTPQAASEHDMNNSNNYLSDLSDDTRRPASHHHQLAMGTGAGAGSARKGPRQQRSDSSGSSYDGDDRATKRRKAGQKQNGQRAHHSSSSSDTNGDDPDRGGGNNVKEEEDDDQRIVDDVYTESDLNHVHAIHGSTLTSELRAAWGIPENVNMLELAREISSLDGEKLAEIRNIVDRYKTERMGIQVENDEVVVDLYSLGPDLLTRLWDFTHSKE